ncbi:branched-chain amino acid ABC transporter permease [uncultured Maritimibacter sp.]|jgi:branched-chain amino acid transport system permease protein|uniref:branched-chain amino acid ABC transporter permease n=1 Tax=uncultured Maritimibacter sp. TaxID=991866 RepID=UPI000A68C928|nr:branched-chain amino acid ABC transporter permease [uncultured Maritimibacter sp.]
MTTRYRLGGLSRLDTTLMAAGAVLLALLLVLPLVASPLVVDKLTLLMIYVLLAVSWNLLAGFAGLVSVGQQTFVGLSGYFVLRLVEAGIAPLPALAAGSAAVLVVAWPLSWIVLRLRAAEFAVAMWVIAETIRSLVMFDPLVQGETGRSLMTLNAMDADLRRTIVLLAAVLAVSVALVTSYRLLRGRLGGESQAIRDDEEAAGSIGIDTLRVKRTIFLVSALGCTVAGSLWLASAITYQPRTAFGINWSVFMLFMVLVGGLGSFTGPVIGALLLFAIQEVFGDYGSWYLAGLGVVAILFALYAPGGVVGLITGRSLREPLSMRKTLVAPRG